MFLTVATISPTSFVAKTMGKASIPANSEKIAHLPSITGKEAAPPIFPNPKTEDPSETTATEFPFPV